MSEEKPTLYPILVGILHFIFFVVVVVLLISFVKDYFPGLRGIFQGTLTYVIIFGSLVALMAALTVYFIKGTKTRMFSGVMKAGSMIIYNLGIYYSLDITVERHDVLIGVDYPGMKFLVVLLLVLYAIYFVFEFILHRKDGEEDVEQDEDFDTRKNFMEKRDKRSNAAQDQSHWK